MLVAVNPKAAMHRTAEISGLPLVSITRTISPRLLELNAAGALNGHVPITAIVSLIVVAAGYLYGYDTTLMALERSADEATSFFEDVPSTTSGARAPSASSVCALSSANRSPGASSTPRPCARAAKSR